jgi:hypothetical protein
MRCLGLGCGRHLAFGRLCCRAALVVALALTGCGGGHGAPAPADFAAGEMTGAPDLAGPVSVARDGGSSDGGGGIVPTGGSGVVPVRSCGTVFTFGDPSPASVVVAGEFNAWSLTANPLTGPDVNGQWQTTMTLPTGAYAYKFVATDPTGTTTWELDAGNPYTKLLGGVENAVVEVRDSQTPDLQ